MTGFEAEIIVIIIEKIYIYSSFGSVNPAVNPSTQCPKSLVCAKETEFPVTHFSETTFPFFSSSSSLSGLYLKYAYSGFVQVTDFDPSFTPVPRRF